MSDNTQERTLQVIEEEMESHIINLHLSSQNMLKSVRGKFKMDPQIKFNESLEAIMLLTEEARQRKLTHPEESSLSDE